ncbi:MAG: DUF1549 domain-containing protein, partial [Planctomycetes bacterium]|nr:DUF1549 domain-containing protein [Planctomycetota bacterium]
MKLFQTALIVAIFAPTVYAADEPFRPELVQRLTVEPSEIRLADQRARQQLIVTAHSADGYLHDATRDVTFKTLDEKIASVEPSGILRPRSAGATKVRITGFGRTLEVPVTVGDQEKPPTIRFGTDVMAILGRAGCNAGSCHGHASGKGGFKLSLRGYDPNADFAALGKRIDRKDPEASSLLLKPTEQEPHRGGKRFDKDSDAYRVLKQWIAEGAKASSGDSVSVKKIEVFPDQSRMPRTGMRQQLMVNAHFTDGTIRDVTNLAMFELSSEGVIEVGPDGLTTGKREGEAAVFVRFLGHMALSRFVIINHHPNFRWTELPENNFVDRYIHAKLKAIQVLPSDLASDAEFLRRVSLDTTGLPPKPSDIRAFLADARSDKRERKIDELLDQEELGDVWATYWLELSGNTTSGDSAGRKGISTLFLWLRTAVNNNMPYDQFMKLIVLGKGSSLQNPAVTF